MNRPNKKGVSEMISYVLLIVIAIGLSVMVYAYLKLYVMPNRPECPTDTNLIVQEVECYYSSGKMNLSVKFYNQGLFNVSAAYVRISKPYKEVRFQINKDEELFNPPISPGNFTWRLYTNLTNVLNISIPSSQPLTLEVQPAIYSKNKLVPCESVITQTINCTKV
jgi:hypothetical protein